ncbi:hypothetical protein [Bradyrhizobium sp. Ec3.3]|uniref:hypothetical protein n=1 Tax=Bradyrhizobium sp. Ec3.3 TaxID=189753 RepID=UPI00042486AC|nr:hypothetical protein [Bradyrhizobium sp. Ec3.3]
MHYNSARPRASGKYPSNPGTKDGSPQTAYEAAKLVVDIAKTNRDKVLQALRGEIFGLSAEGIAGKLGLSRYVVRPRLSELVATGDVIETPFREKNGEGRTVVIWRAAR